METQHEPDRIERTVLIDAPAEVVWDLVAEPGWWINDGHLTEHTIEGAGEHVVVHDPVHGAFPVEVVTREAPYYAAYRWMADADLTGPTTLVEFRITVEGSGVRLTVVESGLSTLGGTLERRRQVFEENSRGWEQMLDLARAAGAPRDAGTTPSDR